VANSIGAIGVNTNLNYLAGVAVETPDNLKLYDLSTNGTPTLFETNAFPTDNDNANLTGSVDFDGDRVFALDSNNGIIALQILPPPTPPTINLQPVSQTIVEGEDANFSIVASGSAPLTYQWRFNGADIATATATNYTRMNAQSFDAGQYSVVVSNSAGSITSQVATLTVNVPPEITYEPQSLAVVAGQNALFQVTADGTMPLSYQWRFIGTNISGATQSMYTRTNAQPSDAGAYSVFITNIAGVISSQDAILTVNVPPQISLQPQSQTVKAGSNVLFTVSASGTAPLWYQWRFNGTNITGATESSYTRNNVQTNDTGNYSVLVTNIAGPALSSNALLTVLLPVAPVFERIIALPNFQIQISGTGEPGTYFFEFSTNLAAWENLGSVLSTNGAFVYSDSSTNGTQRYYRARWTP
jgi:hypothetical protein